MREEHAALNDSPVGRNEGDVLLEKGAILTYEELILTCEERNQLEKPAQVKTTGSTHQKKSEPIRKNLQPIGLKPSTRLW
jgi:hypothetical protein